MLDGSTIAAILTGILALLGALATAWMSGWNEQRLQERASQKALAQYSVPLLIAAWDLANWFFDVLEEDYYTADRCNAYGNGWDNHFTSYLLGQYFAAVHIIREKTHFFAHLRGKRAQMLKKLLWKIHDEFITMHYVDRESLEMRWFEGDILAVQEQMTVDCDLDGDGNAAEMRTIGWVEFQRNYENGPKSENNKSPALKDIFGPYECEFQRIIYRRFKHLYSTKWRGKDNPQEFETEQESLIEEEQRADPNIGIVIPDHRVRRLQHLLSDLVELLDKVSAMEFNRPARRCIMSIGNNESTNANRFSPETERRIICDCLDCQKNQEDFVHRRLPAPKGWKALSMTRSFTGQISVQTIDYNIRRANTEKDGSDQC